MPTPPTSPTPPTVTPTPSPTTCTESFDGVGAPALPSGWVATIENVGNPVPPSWETSTDTPDSGPNDLFVTDQNQVSDKSVTSRDITINSASSVLSFRNFYQTEYDPPPAEKFWDGFVLEVSVNGGVFVDVTDGSVSGGTFATGGYNGEIDGTASNPLAGRPAWCGTSGGTLGSPVYIDSRINLAPGLNTQTIKVRFRFGTDEAQTAPGARVDGLVITGAACP